MEAIIEIWKFISAPIMGAFAWWNVMLHNKIEQNAKDLSEHRLHVAETFTTKADIREMKDDLIKHLNRIENKVDNRNQ